MNLTAVFPVELVERIFDNLALPDLIRSAHVAHQWRAIAFNRPVFWKDINFHMDNVSSPNDAAVALFIARVKFKCNSNILIRVLFATEPPVDVFQEVVLPTIAENLFRIERLVLTIPYFVTGALFEALKTSPAPVLCTFFLGLLSPSGDFPCPLPQSLFAGVAPRLTDLAIEGVMLIRDIPWPTCFKHVSSLSLNYIRLQNDYAHELELEALVNLTSLKSIRLQSSGRTVIPSMRSSALDTIILRLDNLLIATHATILHSFPFWPSTARIRNISFQWVDAECVQAVIAAHMSGSLRMQIVALSESTFSKRFVIYCNYMCVQKGTRRSVIYNTESGIRGYIEPFEPLSVEDVARRVVSLSFQVDTWAETVLTPAPLLNCTTLELILNHHSILTLPVLPFAWDVHLPNVSCLVLKYDGVAPSALAMALPADALRRFIQPWLSCASIEHRSLQLHGISVLGDVTGLPL